MKKTCRLIACTLTLMMALSVPSFGWDNLGHMTVAYVAYQQLKPSVRNRVDALLKLNPQYKTWLTMIPKRTSKANQRMMIFMIAATWPDQIKSLSQYHNDGTDGGNRPPDDPSAGQNVGYTDFARHKYWHFVDMPFTQDGTTLGSVPSPNAQTQIPIFIQTLASTSATDDLKSYDLAWLLHLTGDVHQPLHSAARYGKTQPDGDQGGNLVKLSPPPPKNELHAFWDNLLGTSKLPGDAVIAGKKLKPANPALAGKLDVAVWVDESFQDAQHKVYKKPIGLGEGPFKITPAYQKAAFALAQQRVALAGARLANILNNELK